MNSKFSTVFTKLYFPFVALVAVSCSSAPTPKVIPQEAVTPSSKAYVDSVLLSRKAHDQTFKHPDTSPLHMDSIPTFTHLHYFQPTLQWAIPAHFKVVNSTEVIEMPTTTERIIKMAVYAEVHFNIQQQPYQLNAYQDVSRRDGTVFIPFLDETNGSLTYGGGRYMDVLIPSGDSLILDFNGAYNPYCAYNADYSCPIPPLVNTLPIAVTAGEKILYHH